MFLYWLKRLQQRLPHRRLKNTYRWVIEALCQKSVIVLNRVLFFDGFKTMASYKSKLNWFQSSAEGVSSPALIDQELGSSLGSDTHCVTCSSSLCFVTTVSSTIKQGTQSLWTNSPLVTLWVLVFGAIRPNLWMTRHFPSLCSVLRGNSFHSCQKDWLC